MNQELGKKNVLSQLGNDGALIIMDWAMKYLPQRYREKMTDFYEKRGISWHVSCVITKKEDGSDFESCIQDWYTVANIIENLLKTTKKDNTSIEKVFLRSDNAGCYDNAHLLLALPSISESVGLKHRGRTEICRFDFSDAQSGKDICDQKISPMKSHMKFWVNEKHDITNAEQMKEALDSHGGIKGCQTAVCQTN